MVLVFEDFKFFRKVTPQIARETCFFCCLKIHLAFQSTNFCFCLQDFKFWLQQQQLLIYLLSARKQFQFFPSANIINFESNFSDFYSQTFLSLFFFLFFRSFSAGDFESRQGMPRFVNLTSKVIYKMGLGTILLTAIWMRKWISRKEVSIETISVLNRFHDFTLLVLSTFESSLKECNV